MENAHVSDNNSSREIASSWGEGKKAAKIHPESDFGWILIGWFLGRSLKRAVFLLGPKFFWLYLGAVLSSCTAHQIGANPEESDLAPWSGLQRKQLQFGILGLHHKQKIRVKKFWVQTLEIGEECRQFWA